MQIPADGVSGRPGSPYGERWDDLRAVNKNVNAAIVPEHNSEGLAGEKWLIAPSSGDCNDYAVTKRSELLDRGWPTRALLLSEVVTSWGEHHLVLVVRTSSGDLVLDNMASEIQAVDAGAVPVGPNSDTQKSELLGFARRSQRLMAGWT